METVGIVFLILFIVAIIIAVIMLYRKFGVGGPALGQPAPKGGYEEYDYDYED